MRGIGNKNIQETKSDFSTKFDRLYATQKYIAAFDLCIQNVKTSSIEEVQKKAKLVIPKIKNNLEISNVAPALIPSISFFGTPRASTLTLETTIL